MPLVFEEYQKRAFSTAVYNNKGSNIEYVALGLGGESGEVLEYLKKTIHRNQEIDVELLKGEVGDTLWYVSGILSESMMALASLVEYSEFRGFESYVRGNSWYSRASIGRIAIYLDVYVGRVLYQIDHKLYGNCDPQSHYSLLRDHLLKVLECLTAISHKAGFRFEDAALYNLEKLAYRSARGKLKGSGDNR